MTTLESLTLEQVQALGANAATAGDADTVRDCATVEAAYLRSDQSELSAMVDHERGEVREAARRIVAVISDGEAAAS
jgi:hypothetical protein